MATSNIKLFDENKGNMISDSEFNISNQRLNGLQTGVASSQLQNKAMYQASLVAYAIAQIMLQNGLNANDTDAVSAFVANLSGTILQKVHDIATTAEAQEGVATGKWMSPALVKSAFDYRKATVAEAQAGDNDTKWVSPALVKAFSDNAVIPIVNSKVNISDKATEQDIENLNGDKWVTAYQFGNQVKQNYIPMYLAFAASVNDDSVSSALGKNNDDIKYIGKALTKYELFKGSQFSFAYLQNVNNMSELLANVNALAEVYKSTYVYTLLMNNTYSKSMLDSMNEATFCMLVSALAGVPDYTAANSYSNVVARIPQYSSGYVYAFSRIGENLYSIHGTNVRNTFFSTYSAATIFASNALVNFCLDMTDYAKHINDNASSFVDAANASGLVQNYSGNYNGYDLDITPVTVKCFVLSAEKGGTQNSGGVNVAYIYQGMFTDAIATPVNGNQSIARCSGLFPCNFIRFYSKTNYNKSVHNCTAKYIPHS